MSEQAKLYIAGIGMITPVGANTAMTAAAVRAGMSGYKISSYYGQNDVPITMATVPDSALRSIKVDIDEGDRFNDRHDRIIRMSILAIREACAPCQSRQPIPLMLAMPETEEDTDGLAPLVPTLEHNCQPWLSQKQHWYFKSGRSAGMEAIEFSFRYFRDIPADYVLVGGSDSYQDDVKLAPFKEDDRLLTEACMDGFAPGEAASFLLLTNKPELALKNKNHVIALHYPGISDEPGHLHSDVPYKGDGLDQAFKKALQHVEPGKISRIYSSMNGENHWAKEYGVAYIRNKDVFSGTIKVEHPADCYGDLGSATSTALIALAAENLFSHSNASKHLVYSSSDTTKRGAIILNKLHVDSIN